MSEVQIVVMVIAIIVILIGVLIIWKRKPFSAEARRYRREMGIHVGPHTQSPLLVAVVGGAFVGFGAFALIAIPLGIIGP